jgi:hypothetical protein
MAMSRGLWLWALSAALVCGGALWAPPAAQSQGNIEVGPFRILSTLDLSSEYNDNILLSPPGQEIDDFIWTISPGVVIELPGRRWAARLGVRADVIRYTENSSEDTTDWTVQGPVQGNFAGGLTVSLTDDFKDTQDFAGFPVPELNNLVKRYENLLRAEAEYVVRERWSVGAHYNFLWVDYHSGAEFDVLDRQDHTVGAQINYRIMPKTAVLAAYDYQIIRYDEPSTTGQDSDSHFIWGGIKGDLTAKTSALVKVGYQWKTYDDPAVEDFDGVVVEAEVVWKYRDPSQLRLYAGRANVESTFEGSNYYIATYGGVELRHYLTQILILTARGLVGVNEYPNETTLEGKTAKRDDTFFEAGISLRYQFRRWLAFELAYQYLHRDSNFDDFEYRNNRVIGTVHLSY